MIFEKTITLQKEVVPSQPLWGREGAFTTMPLFEGDGVKLSLLALHVDRVLAHLSALVKNHGWTREDLEREVLLAVEACPWQGSRLLRISLTRELCQFSFREWQPTNTPLRAQPVTLERRFPELKSLFYEEVLDAVQPFHSVEEEVVLLNKEQVILEGAFTNLWFFRGEQLVLPAGPSLAGITQQVLLKKLQINPPRETIRWADRFDFTEILCVGSGRGVRPLIVGNEKQQKGNMCEKIQTAYAELLREWE